VESLNLSQAQQDQIRDIRERNRQAKQALQERMRSDVLAVLTAEQQAKLKQLQAERRRWRPEPAAALAGLALPLSTSSRAVIRA
jgi:Spy/CpxP family protein refolding chaperone